MKFAKGMKIDILSTELRNCVKEPYKLTQGNDGAIEAIVINLVATQLDDDIQRDIKVLQRQDIGS